MKAVLGLLLFFAIVAAGIGVAVFAPVAIIWSLNTLFGLAIPYAFKAWVATVILVTLLFGAGSAGSIR